MPRCHEHNIIPTKTPSSSDFGIRISLLNSDPFAALVGTDWEKYQWFSTEDERDAELAEMARQHQYSRSGDRPTLRFEKVLRERHK